MNHDVVIYIISMLATIFLISLIILAALLYESKQKRKETEKQLRDMLDLPIPEPKIETYRLATLHAWVEVDVQMVEFVEPETLDAYLRAELAHKIADGIKPRLKIEKKRATMYGIRYETELTVKEEPPVETFTQEGGKA